MVDEIEQQIYQLIRPYAGSYLFGNKDLVLTADTDLDTDLSIDELEAEDFMNEYFSKFGVNKSHFDIKTYYPAVAFSWNPFKKSMAVAVPDFTIGMLIESAKAGRWIYD
jgi:hypothetical protein